MGNHDVTRIASKVGADGAGLAAAVLLTIPGSPSIHYGDEHGFTGVKYERRGGDDARIDVHLDYRDRRVGVVAPGEELHFGG